MEALLAPIEFEDEDRELAAQVMAERTPEDIAAALVHAHPCAYAKGQRSLIPHNRTRHKKNGVRPGFEGSAWFRLNAGRRQNADPRWILPLICRRGHVTRQDIGAIRMGRR